MHHVIYCTLVRQPACRNRRLATNGKSLRSEQENPRRPGMDVASRDFLVLAVFWTLQPKSHDLPFFVDRKS
jgi:hypothetical protein